MGNAAARERCSERSLPFCTHPFRRIALCRVHFDGLLDIVGERALFNILDPGEFDVPHHRPPALYDQSTL